MTYTLGVDLGTTYSAVAVHRQGHTEIVPLAHRALVTPSAVFVTADGAVLVGDAALRRGVVEPGRLAREFKRRLGDPVPLLVGGAPYRAETLTALLLESLVAGVVEQQGGRPARTVLTFPANWGPHKQDLLTEAIRLADVTDAAILTEPEAAAIWYASAERIAPGETVAVYDLGGGTFDAAVLRKAPEGFEVLGTPQGIDRLGGIDVDEAIFRHVCEVAAVDVRTLATDEGGRRAAARLRADCVEAKEALSADTTATVTVALPDLHRDVRLTRAEVETMVRPVLEDTIHALREAIRSAGLDTDDVDRVLLVGGASRMPVVGDMVSQALGRPFFVDAHPKHVVAMGAALAAASREAGDAVRVVPPPPPGGTTVEPPPHPPVPAPPTVDEPEPPPPPIPPPGPEPPPSPFPEPAPPAPEPPAPPPPGPEPLPPQPPLPEPEPPPLPEPEPEPPAPIPEPPHPPRPEPPAPEPPAPPRPEPPTPPPVPEPPLPEPPPPEPTAPTPTPSGEREPEPATAGAAVSTVGLATEDETEADAPPTEEDESMAPVAVATDDRIGGNGQPAPPVTTPRPEGQESPWRRHRAWLAVPAALVVLAVIVTVLNGGGGGGGGGVDARATTTTRPPVVGVPGGEVVDLAVFNRGIPPDLDPALSPSRESGQVVDSLYDGLTTVDIHDPGQPQVVPVVAESWTASDDATVWTFTVREGVQFSDGSPVLPSSFVRGWERATAPGFADPASSVFEVIEGATEKLAGEADTIAGLQGNDGARTLEVRLAEPMATFDALVAFQLFMPMPEAVESLGDQASWDDGLMIGNGPFMQAAPRSASELVLVRNPRWDGTRYDGTLRLPEQPFLERITLRASADSFSAYEAFENGGGQVALVPTGSFADAETRYRTAFEAPLVVSYHLQVDWDHPDLGGPENRLLRQAISQAIDREAIGELLHDGTSHVAAGITPPAFPGFADGLCGYCSHDAQAAEDAFAAWRSEGNELDEPIRIQSGAGPDGGDPVVASIVEDLAAVGIEAVEEPLPSGEYVDRLRDGGCQLCQVATLAHYLSYDAFLYSFFGSDNVGDPNYGGFTVDDFDRRLDDAAGTVDADRRADVLHEAERLLLDEETGVIPLLWHSQGYAYTDQIAALPQTGSGLIIWERVYLDS